MIQFSPDSLALNWSPRIVLLSRHQERIVCSVLSIRLQKARSGARASSGDEPDFRLPKTPFLFGRESAGLKKIIGLENRQNARRKERAMEFR